MKGIVLKYNQKNINTDLIIPARYLNDSDPEHLGSHCMEDLDKDFKQKKDNLGATIIVADSNFGSGSSREQAPIALKAAGIKCVIAPSFARIFYRNAINIGLSIIEFNNISNMNTGDELEINFDDGIINNITNNMEFKINKIPRFLQDIISTGGLVKFARKKILEN
ncbi:MAG: 3-isopropylmalate dehydratase small subunit [Candidatus Lokiarchaeota archaeon]|nr:3-isopropylmalate dehydratase small subunit [Candidatus Lokiarchaeota archaeon]